MSVLKNLKPERVFHYFEEICAIPHPSYHEEKISNYLVEFAKKHNLEYHQDELFNVIIIKEASKGFENRKPIILQGHMDMVCEKESSCTKDMMTEGLDLRVDGDWISAQGTTLGGDDGIAVAMALAILEDDKIKHPRLEFLCTVSEEVGMEGAAGVDAVPLLGHLLINIDSEEEGAILAGCAGGSHVGVKLEMPKCRIVADDKKNALVKVHIHNLTGGHSGAEIHKERANADIWAVTLLRELALNMDIRLVYIEGGAKDNAIPRESRFAVAASDGEAAVALLQKASDGLKSEFSASDPKASIDISVSAFESIPGHTKESTDKFIALFSAIPNGVIRVSQDVENLVETSLNLGIISLSEDASEAEAHYALRSSVDSAKQHLRNQLVFVAKSYGARVELGGDYPAWQYRKDSILRSRAASLWQKMYGKRPRIEAIHAGLECGLLSGKIENLDCISIGPSMRDIHTTEERLSVSSTRRVYEFLVRLIGESFE